MAYPAVFTLFDAFPGIVINPANWQNVESVDVITGGELVFDRRVLYDPACDPNTQNCDEEGMDGNLLELMSQIPTHFQADVQAAGNATTASTNCLVTTDCALRIGVGGTLYNDGTGLSGDAGNVNAILTLQKDPGPGTWDIKYYIWHCPDANCRTPVLTAVGTLLPNASTDTYYRLVMDWDTTANTLTFAVDTGAPVTVDLAVQGFPAISRLPQNPFAGFLGLTFNTVSTTSEDYRISGKVDNILFY